MDTTVDAELIGKMIHSSCDRHHCDECTKAAKNKPKPPPTSSLEREASPPPEFLHCGRWPPSANVNDPENNDNDNEPMGSEDRFSKDSTYPPLSNIDEDGLVSDFDSTCSIRGSSTAGEEEEGTSTSLAQRVRPLKVTWQDLSEAVDSWKINADEDLEETTGESTNGKKGTTTTPPYSVLKLLPRLQNHSLHGLHQGSGSRSGSEGMAVSRQSLFDQEINAEGQARVEITSYIDSLVDRGSYEEGYGWVWPLEDYRREGWSREMVRAYPGECAAFVGGGGRQGQLGDATYSGHGGRE